MNITLCTLNTKICTSIKTSQNIALIKIAKTLKKKSPENKKIIPFLFKSQIRKFEQTHTHVFTCNYPFTDIIHIHTHKPLHSIQVPNPFPPPHTQKK